MRPEHLLEQADQLLTRGRPGALRSADKARAVSAAYYALFHRVLAAAADALVGGRRFHSPAYRLAYRSIPHGRVRAVCLELCKPVPTASFRSYWPADGFDPAMVRFAQLYIELIEARHAADYDPTYNPGLGEAQRLIDVARSAIDSFERADGETRRVFLTFLVCDPRSAG